jgi:hypothetical protein
MSIETSQMQTLPPHRHSPKAYALRLASGFCDSGFWTRVLRSFVGARIGVLLGGIQAASGTQGMPRSHRPGC